MHDPSDPRARDPREHPIVANLNWKSTLFMGLVLIAGGVACLAFPFFASLTVTAVASVAFLLGGALQLWLVLRGEEGTSGGRAIAGALGLLMVVFAVLLWANPLAGLVSLTVMMAVVFLSLGAMRIMVALRMRHRRRWGWVMASGVLSALLGLIILVALPASALSTLGLLLGIELTMSGAALVVLALAARES